jgi:dTDP-4-dehydrorhamnose reductase
MESEPPDPANLYGESKLAGELEALAGPGNVVIRTSWLFGRSGAGSMDFRLPRRGRGGPGGGGPDRLCNLRVPSGQGPGAGGGYRGTRVFHCVNPGALSPLRLAELLRKQAGQGDGAPRELVGPGASRPAAGLLSTGTEREVVLPPIEEALEEWLGTLE